MEKKLEVKNLVISFKTQGGKVQAVRDISFDLYKGETLAIVGESGSGKSVTNRAIIGISAGNAIIEGGEILYDGQDLLKISEEDFHKLRGDKIAMIFQDPMSSLNPIMKVGRQLTEAMLLKAKASSRSARKAFNSKLAILNENMDELAGENQEVIKKNGLMCNTFDDFCIESITLEGEYNEANRHCIELKDEVDQTILYVEKKQKLDLKRRFHEIKSLIEGTIHPYLVHKDEKTLSIINLLENTKGEGSLEEINALKDLSLILDEAAKKEEPNYFTLGYYMFRNPSADVSSYSIDELNHMTREYLDAEFMNNFISEGSLALKNCYDNSSTVKKNTIASLEELRHYFEGGSIADKGEALAKVKEVSKEVEAGINKLELIKNSHEYMFKANMTDLINKYFHSIKTNNKETKRFEKQSARHDALVAKGKKLDWKVIPAAITDLNLIINDILNVIDVLKDVLEKQISSYETFDYKELMVSLIDWFKEQASKAVYKVTPKLAKIRAIKLLDEVGIAEPAARYNQYPFELSGGMRQRIVIAIALAANPDILICDEPTTALDVTIQAQILELINRIKKERNLSVIFITHNLGVVANMADRVAVMYAGKIVEMGTADDVFYDPRHPYTWALLSSMPDLDSKDKLEAIPGTPPNMIFPPKGDAFAQRNKYALKIDFELQPPMFKVSDTHYAATWLLHEDAPKIEPPKAVTDRIQRMKKR